MSLARAGPRLYRSIAPARLVASTVSRSFSRALPRHDEKPTKPIDPYPLPLSREIEHQRAAPSAEISSSTSSDLNTDGGEADWPMPQPLDRTGESEEKLRARLVYQTRKRGMLEGDLLLSTFARDELAGMNVDQLREFDKILDENDWDIYYWSIEKRNPPPKWANTEILAKLKQHARNEGKVVRVMPDLSQKE